MNRRQFIFGALTIVLTPWKKLAELKEPLFDFKNIQYGQLVQRTAFEQLCHDEFDCAFKQMARDVARDLAIYGTAIALVSADGIKRVSPWEIPE